MPASRKRRLSLLTGPSLVAASLSAFAFTGVAMAPATALAYDECVPSSGTTLSDGPGGAFDVGLNGATADTFICAVSVPAISYPNTNGNLTLQLQNNVTTTTGGLVAVGTGTNSVTISRIADSPANSGDLSLTSTSATDAALQVSRATAGGTINVNLTDNDTTDTALVISGVAAGVRLSNMGTSATSFTTTNGTISASAGPAIQLSTSGTGGLTLTNGSAATGTTAGAHLRNTGGAGGALTVTNSGSLVATAGAGIDAETTGTGAISVTNSGTVTGTTGAISVASGSAVTITNSSAGVLNGSLTFANTGATVMTNDGRWNAGGASVLRSPVTATGSATLSSAGVIATNLDGAVTSIDFGVGGATFANSGRLVAGVGTEGAATLTLSNLAAWNNSGIVTFGGNEDLSGPDGVTNDRIVMTRTGGGTFTGSGASKLVMDVDFGASQLNCSAAVTADCLDLRGMNTAGSSTILVNTIGQGFGAERIVLVDVAGAGTDAAVFTLDAGSDNYRAVDDGLIDAGLFLYALNHDTDAKQHVLEAVAADGEAFELVLIGRAASEPWRTTTGMWHDRQADLRNSIAGRAEGYAPGVWLKVAGSFIDESRLDTLAIGSDTLDFNTSYAQETTAIVGGVDLLRFIGENSAWVLGVTAGKVDSNIDFTVGQSLIDLEGHSFGAYASVLAGRAFFDAILNTTNLDLVHNGFGAEFESAAQSFGYQLEGGYRLFQINEDGAWLEPLASLSYLSTDIDDLHMGGATTSFEEASSLRYALGLRLGGDLVMDALRASFSATGRVWKQAGGDNTAVMSAGFGDTDLREDGIDNLGDLGAAVSLFTLGGHLSAHLAYNVLFKDDYQNTGVSLGLRYNW